MVGDLPCVCCDADWSFGKDRTLLDSERQPGTICKLKTALLFIQFPIGITHVHIHTCIYGNIDECVCV